MNTEAFTSLEWVEQWIPAHVILKFLVGEIPLFSKSFAGFVPAIHFTDLPGDIEQLSVDAEKLLVQAEVVYVPSFKISRPLLRIHATSGFIRYIPRYYRHYYVVLEGSFEEYISRFSSKTRSTLRRKVRKLADYSGGTVLWRKYSSGKEMLEFHNHARTVSVKTYQERLLGSGLPSSERFRDELVELAHKNSVLGYTLFIDSQPAAYVLSTAREGVLHYDYVGFDPAFASWSPGTVLQYVVLQDLFQAHEFRIFDFTEGGGPHKRLFATHGLDCADVYFFSRAARNRSLIYLHHGLTSISRGGVRILSALRINRATKKYIRQMARPRPFPESATADRPDVPRK